MTFYGSAMLDSKRSRTARSFVLVLTRSLQQRNEKGRSPAARALSVISGDSRCDQS
jgi:hypothetical protein